MSLGGKLEDRIFWTEWEREFPDFNPHFYSDFFSIFFIKYLNFVAFSKDVMLSMRNSNFLRCDAVALDWCFFDVSEEEGTTFIENVRKDPMTHRHIPEDLKP